MTASSIGRIGQARFLFLIRAYVGHPGHASLCGPIDAACVIAARFCHTGSGEPRFGTPFSLG